MVVDVSKLLPTLFWTYGTYVLGFD